MCGIFGYVGEKRDASHLILEGLKLLEYRGYDSWGIAVKDKGKIKVAKHVGKIGQAVVKLPSGSIGIGHTRWATHGGVTVKNSHPHLDCTKKIAVIHNGIIENFAQLKEQLIKRGHRFVSETDTEVVSHLVEENLKSSGFSTAVRDAFNKLKGMNAVVIMNAISSEIIAAKNGSPLVIGMGSNEFFIASDASGIIKHTRKVIFLRDNEMVILGKNMKLLFLPKGEELKRNYETIDWKMEDVGKGQYPHFMLKEIIEQPKVIRNIAQNLNDQIIYLAKVIKKAEGTFFIGAGTAFHACLVGSYLFSSIADTHVNTAPASEFNYLEDFLTEKSLIIALSQSGETIDVVEPLIRAKEKGSSIIAIVNSLGSTIYRISDYKLLLDAGSEKAVASTKAYVAKLSVMLMLVFAMINKTEKARALLLKTAKEVDRLLDNKNIGNIKKIASTLKRSEHIYIIGRGVSYPTSLEAALKIKEVSYIHTEGLAGGELKHGTIALITKKTPCMVFAPNDQTYASVMSNAMEVKARGGIIIGISAQKEKIFDYWLEVKDVKEASIIAQIVPAQLLGYFLALEKGYDPDKPRNLAKSVTVK